MNHIYGMRLRGFSIATQPSNGLIGRAPESQLKNIKINRYYHDLIMYNRKLKDDEIYNYDLDYLGEVK